MRRKSKIINEMKVTYRRIKDKIDSRLDDFKGMWNKGSERDIFKELIFCLLTPQSKAKACWDCVERLSEKGLLLKGSSRQMVKHMTRVRFMNNKAGYIVLARKMFFLHNRLHLKSILRQFHHVSEARDWLVGNIKGMGYKEASHFLRNIGKGEDLAILDRHILRNLERASVIDKMPEYIPRRAYLSIEEKMRKFSNVLSIPLGHMDVLLWYKETGEIFK